MPQARQRAGGVTAADLVSIAAPLQLSPGWLPPEPRAITGDCVIHEVGDAVPPQPGGVLLLVGARAGDPATAAAVRAAGEIGYACVLVKSRDDDLDSVVAAAEEAEVPLMIAPDETPWRDVDKLVSAVVDVQGAGIPDYADVRPGDLFALANAIAYSVGGATSIEDFNGRMFAYSNLPHQKIDDIRLRSITDRQTPIVEGDVERYLRIRNSPKPVRLPSPDPQYAHRLAISVRAGTEMLGMIWVLDGEPALDKGASKRLEDAASVAALHLLQVRQQENGRRWERSEVLASLLSARIGAGVASALIGLPADVPTTVLAISASSGGEPSAVSQARTLDMINLYCEAWHPRALATTLDGLIYAVLPGSRTTSRGRSLASFARDVCDTARRTTGVELRFGIGSTVESLEAVVESRRLADLTLAALDREIAAGPVATVEDMRSRVVLGELGTRRVLDLELPGDPLAVVLEHDRDRGTNYADSLLAYLEAFGDTARAAKALCVHENTLRYRIRRLEEMFELRLDDPDVRLVAWLQLRLARD